MSKTRVKFRNFIGGKIFARSCNKQKMPLLKRKPFKRNPIPDGLKDDDEVFYCKQTKEVFKSYE